MDYKRDRKYISDIRRHYELAYVKIHRQLKSKWFQYAELFFYCRFAGFNHLQCI